MPPKITATLKWAPKLKEAFFDREAIISALDEKTLASLKWFGGRMREKTRQRIGKPNIEGSTKVNRKGEESKVKRRKVRPKGTGAPIARVSDNETLSLRNVQYKADLSRADANVIIYIPRFNNDNVPETHEFGGSTRVRAKVADQLTKTGKVKKKKGKAQKKLIFSKDFPKVTFAVPKRPMLAPVFDKTYKEFLKRMAQGRFG